MISILVPFREDNSDRARLWAYCRAFWERELPEAEIVVGSDDGIPFSRSVALNAAFRQASGDTFVIADSDTIIYPEVVRECVAAIAASRRRPLWFVPWQRRVDLFPAETAKVLAHARVPRFPTDPDSLHRIAQFVRTSPSGLLSIVSRRAWERVGGHDERFVGWGGEDTAFFAALDTLYGRHQRTDNDVYHLYHPRKKFWGKTLWDGQEKDDFKPLRNRYTEALGDRDAMRALVDEGLGSRDHAASPPL